MTTSSGVGKGAAETRDEPGLAPPIVSAEEFHRRAAANVHARAREAHLAFYSSWTDCITTDPAAMVLPMDDHMAHRGHGVFDTAHLHAGHLHMLDRHVSRFFKSMRAANIPPPFDRRVVTSLILRVAAAGGSREGQLRFYASAGPGGFALDQSECVKSVFYCVAVKKRQDAEKTNRGVAVVTSSVPIKPPAFATVKSTNYLPNALVVADAKRRGAQYGIWLTEDGKHVAEGPSMNAGFVVRRAPFSKRRFENETSVLGDDRDGTPIEDGMEESKTELRFLTPPWDETLAGCTVARAVELVNEGRFEHLGLKGPALIEPVSLAEARNAAELMLIGSVINCLPITRWDGTEVGEVPGVVGPVAVAMRDAIEADFETNAKELTRVPYETFETRVVKEQ